MDEGTESIEQDEIKEDMEEYDSTQQIIPEIIELKAQDLENVLRIYETICKAKKCTKEKEQLDKKLSRIASILKEAMREEVSLPLRNATILKAKGELLGMAFEKMFDDDDDIEIWKEIKSEYDKIIKECLLNIESPKPKEPESDTKVLTELIENLKEELRIRNEEKMKLQKMIDEDKVSIVSSLKRSKTVQKRNTADRKFLSESPLKCNKSPFIEAKNYSTTKFMSLKQLKDAICDIYQQKIKYDKKSTENHLPRESMEQFMYTYLNQIYGLKSLIVEGAGGIMQGINKYSSIDSDVALFGKILKNQCDEDFRFVFSEVKIAMGNILRDRLRNKHKLKTEAELDKILNEIQRGIISKTYWTGIITKMYNEEHRAMLNKRIREKIEINSRNRKSDRRLNNDRGRIQHDEILYCDLQKIILDFQLNTHETYIKRFTRFFQYFFLTLHNKILIINKCIVASAMGSAF